MSLAFPLAVLLGLSATAQGPEVGKMTAAVAPFVGDEVAVAVHVNLARWDVSTSSRRLLGKLADDADVAGIAKIADGWVDALKKAGATDLFLLVDVTDMPGYPLLVVPLAAGNDGRAIVGMLSERGPIRWPATEVSRGAGVAGTPEGLARVRDARPASRPEFAAAMAAGGDSTIHLAILLRSLDATSGDRGVDADLADRTRRRADHDRHPGDELGLDRAGHRTEAGSSASSCRRRTRRRRSRLRMIALGGLELLAQASLSKPLGERPGRRDRLAGSLRGEGGS